MIYTLSQGWKKLVVFFFDFELKKYTLRFLFLEFRFRYKVNLWRLTAPFQQLKSYKTLSILKKRMPFGS